MLKKIITALLILFVIALLILITASFQLKGENDWQVAKVLRTADHQFNNLANYPFAPNYAELLGYRVHYVDEGPKDAPVIVLMHGEPSWSYLYRFMIPPLVDAGYRVIAPDLVGFGKSDKPIHEDDYSYQMHVDVMGQLITQLNLLEVTLFVQDWGGLIGLRVVADHPTRFARIMLSNTGFPAVGGFVGQLIQPLFQGAVWSQGNVSQSDLAEHGFSFLPWVAYTNTDPDFDMGFVLQSLTTRVLTDNELAAYNAPFPSNAHKAGARAFPRLVTSQLSENQQAMETVFLKWQKPVMTAFSDSDPLTAGGEKPFQNAIPGGKNQQHVIVSNGGHFIQEDQPEVLVELLLGFIKRTPLSQ